MKKSIISSDTHKIRPYGAFINQHKGRTRALMVQRDQLLAMLIDLEDRIRKKAPGHDARWTTWQELER